ncbi:MAG: hypothetical protein Q7S37_04995 [bacterium]|nr:hypothetical protein [bacterium]
MLTKDDLRQIKGVVGEVVEREVGNLAVMTAKEFGRVHKKLEEHDGQFELLKRSQVAHDFKMTEMVHKADYYILEERVKNIETKLGLKAVLPDR